MGLLDGLLAPALTVATQAAGANEQGKQQGSALLRAIGMQQLAMQEKQAQIAKTAADTRFTLHRNTAPVLGEPGYNDAKAGEAGAVEGAVQPIRTQGAIATAAGTEPIKTQGAIDVAKGTMPIKIATAGGEANATLPAKQQLARTESDLTEGREGRLLGKRIEAQNGSARIGLSAAQQFKQQNKTLVDAVPAYLQAKTHFAEARAGNPAALKSALLAYASVADPKAQLRQGVMNYVTKVDPSFKGTFEMAVDRLASGKLPPRVIDDMERVIDSLHHEHAAMYEQRRNAFVNSVPSAGAYIPATDDLFTLPNSGGHAKASPGPSAPGTYTFNGVTYKVP